MAYKKNSARARHLVVGFLIFFLLMEFASASSVPIYVKPLASNGSLNPDTTYTYSFNWTTDSTCNTVIFSNSNVEITTGKDGVGFTSLTIPDSISSLPNYICEYRNGALRSVHSMSSQFSDKIFTQSIRGDGSSLTNVNASSLGSYSASFFMPLNKSVFGDFNFNGGWTSGGLSIIGGGLYSQNVYTYNLSNLNVSNLNINGSLLPQSSFDNQFDLGSSSLRWKDLYIGGNLYADGSLYENGNSLSDIYYLKSNPFSFYNSTTIPNYALNSSLSSYYSISNPYGYYNSTTLPTGAVESDPRWTGNFTAYNSSWSSTFNSTYNNYINSLSSIDCGAGSLVIGVQSNGTILCAEDQVGSPGAGDIESVHGDNDYIYNGSNSGAVNLRFNETRLNQTIDLRGADTVYSAGSNLTLTGTTFAINMTTVKNYFDPIYQVAGSYVTIPDIVSLVGNWTLDKANYYNKTEIEGNLSGYYLKTNPFGFYNSTNPPPGSNSSFNQSLTDSLYYQKNNPSSFYNSTTLQNLSQLSNNFNFINQTYTNLTYYLASNPSGYISSETLWNANSSTVARTGNCPTGQVVQNITTGGVQCVTDQTGSGEVGNPFDQSLNTTDNIKFNTLNITGIIKSGDWSNISGNQINNNLNWINWSHATNGTLALSSQLNNYYPLNNPYGYYNSTTLPSAGAEGDPLWTANQTNYFNKSQILGFGFYNSSNFAISDYYTKIQINNFGYYNSTDFDINNYYLKSNPSNYWNATFAVFNKTYADTLYYSVSNPSSYVTNSTMNKSVSCSDIIGGSDGDFCTDATGGGGGTSGANVSTTTCSGTDKVSAINNVTGEVTCSADATGGSLTYQEANRATDLALSTSFQTATSLNLGAGTWLVIGQSSIESTSTTQGNVNIRIRDQTNSITYSIAEAEVDSALPDSQSLSVHAVIVLSGSATIALEGRRSAGTSHMIGPGNLGDTATKVTHLTAVKIA